jgi:hypothetical protein
MGHHNLLFVTDNSAAGGIGGRLCRSCSCKAVTQERIARSVAEVLPCVAMRNVAGEARAGT